MNDEPYDVMRDTIALVVARYRDDEEGGMAILENANLGELLMALTDYSVALIKTMCRALGMPEDKFMDSLAQNAGMLFGMK